MNWFGYVNSRDDTSHVRRCYKEEFPGKQSRGRPRKRQSDQIKDEECGIPLLTIERKNKGQEEMERECARTLEGLQSSQVSQAMLEN